ncbi:hypothetical protein L9W73_15510 [Vibrio aestuarianus]|uniref:Uncharacterized protein n=1 Tax=Vibrio aestuarianus TaxID=28171 RepID=A0A9X4IVB3_9VIBR|nr:hypothetical protein [Vibrio aestuarianus]NGZ64837.1 hypothetical protein [Vibrio aestuarianus subsp. cardii]MDE1234366.1 hypothetical protein [Vibrio aestuarianus]MDE1245188.1 hypothetical protein [Vibrio aestuarianus]MDE1309900.1 hypothetical protein [Vibrio aestuarianus]MDE1325919.1 hypothetical protein [Vibrio aestuarianus]
MKTNWRDRWLKFKHTILEAMDFRSRIWVVRISETRLKDESFIINEDSFNEPLQWMKRRSYSSIMLAQVEHMKCSQVHIFTVGNQTHQLLRVK